MRLLQPAVVLLVGKMAIEHFLGRCRLEDVVGTLVERDGRRYLPLPHSSGVSRWLNDPGHRALASGHRAPGRVPRRRGLEPRSR